MCLNVDFSYHHHDKRGRVVRRRAKQDILVYKVLRPLTQNSAASPYQGTQWTFGVEKTSIMKAQNDGYDCYVVEEALHSCLNMDSARSHSNYYRNIYPAVIPKGSMLIYGDNDEVASNRLIVYRDESELMKARGAIGPGIPRGEIANFGKGK